MKDLGSFSNTFKQTIGRVPGDALPYFSLTSDGGDFYVLPSMVGGDWSIEFAFVLGSPLTIGTEQDLLICTSSSDDVVLSAYFTFLTTTRFNVECQNNNASDSFSYTTDSGVIIAGDKYRVGIVKNGQNMQVRLNDALVVNHNFAQAIDYASADRCFLFAANATPANLMCANSRVIGMTGMFGWPSLISTKKAYADVAKTTPITNGSACAVIETAAGDIVQSSAGAMATANIPPV